MKTQYFMRVFDKTDIFKLPSFSPIYLQRVKNGEAEYVRLFTNVYCQRFVRIVSERESWPTPGDNEDTS